MIAWIILNTLFRVGIMVIVAYKLTAYRDMFNCAERIGLGMAGGAAFLTLPQIWAMPDSPFEGWASTVFSAGFFIYLMGRMSRHWRHRRNNNSMKRRAA
jgi:hypothetical protein